MVPACRGDLAAATRNAGLATRPSRAPAVRRIDLILNTSRMGLVLVLQKAQSSARSG
jgi:hypothetical protein